MRKPRSDRKITNETLAMAAKLREAKFSWAVISHMLKVPYTTLISASSFPSADAYYEYAKEKMRVKRSLKRGTEPEQAAVPDEDDRILAKLDPISDRLDTLQFTLARMEAKASERRLSLFN